MTEEFRGVWSKRRIGSSSVDGMFLDGLVTLGKILRLMDTYHMTRTRRFLCNLAEKVKAKKIDPVGKIC